MPKDESKIKFRHRLLTRLLISHILIVSIPLFFAGRVLVETAQDSIKETILERNLEFADRSTRFIDLKLETARDLIKSQAKLQSIFGIIKTTQDLAINTLINEFDFFSKLTVLDTLGNLVASTSFDDMVHKNSNGKSVINTILAAFEKGLEYRTDVYISDESLPMLDIAEPIMFYNEVVGILYAIVDLKSMWAVVDQNKVGEHGEAFIFDHDGIYIAHSDRINVYSKKIFRKQEVIEDIKNGKGGSLIYKNENGVEMVAAYAPIGDYPWGAMLQQPTSEAFEPATRMGVRVIQFMIVSVLLASLIAFLYSKIIVKPVDLLVSGMEKYALGELDYRIAKVTDDEIGTLAENFNEMAERLIEFQNKLKRTEVLQTLAKLSTVLSHEIRNPLNSMVINMQILRRELSKEKINKERVEKFYGILAAEIKRVDQLVSDFLLIARPPKMEKTVAALNVVLDDVVTIQVAESLSQGVRIERDYQKKPIKMNIDVAKMRQVFLNLLRNATQAMPGGGKLLISMRETKSTSRSTNPLGVPAVIISFSDTGYGIEKKDIDKIFDFYYTTKEEGSGLGLAIVQQIVDEHQGKITVESKISKGTKFTIFLPEK